MQSVVADGGVQAGTEVAVVCGATGILGGVVRLASVGPRWPLA